MKGWYWKTSKCLLNKSINKTCLDLRRAGEETTEGVQKQK